MLKCFLPGLIFLTISVFASGASAEMLVARCEAVDISIRHSNASDATIACESAQQAITFLEKIGLFQTRAIEIDLVPELPPGLQGAVGCYEWESHRIYLLPASDCLTAGYWPEIFRELDSEGIYRSFVAHEVAHAVAATSFRIENPTMATQEYIAAIVQFGSMENDLRSAIFSQFEGEGYDDPSDISLILYYFNPIGFGVECYRHFRKPENGQLFIQDLLSGKIHLPDELE